MAIYPYRRTGFRMADTFRKHKRSEIMRSVRSRGNLSTEQRLAQLFREAGITGWRRHYGVIGTPDFYFPRERVAVFVDGCFWHGCPRHGTVPVTRRTFWKSKIDRNRRRDILVARTLRRRRVSVVRVWEHELRAVASATCLSRILAVLHRPLHLRSNMP